MQKAACVLRPKHDGQLADVEHAVQVGPLQANAVGLGRCEHRLTELCGGGIDAAVRLEHEDMHGLGAAAQIDAIEAAETRTPGRRQAVAELGRHQGLVVAGMVDQARRDVDGVAEAVALHLDDLAVGHRHLQAQRLEAGGGAALTAHGDQAGECFVHGQRGIQCSGGRLEDGHQTVSERLDQMPADAVHRQPHLADGVRHHRGGLGVAEGFEQRRAAAQVRKQDGALADLRHRDGIKGSRGKSATCRNDSGA
jgi:hypothetical protein